MKKSEPWYIHAGLWTVIVVLAYILIQVAIIQPRDVMQMERYYKAESRARMVNLRNAEILWQEQKEYYTDNLDSLIDFIKTDSSVIKLVNGFDSVTVNGVDTIRSTNPFIALVSGEFYPESLSHSPKSLTKYVLKIDTAVNYDTTVNRYGRLVKIDTILVFGTRYFLEDVDGYGNIGDVYNSALKNTASWE